MVEAEEKPQVEAPPPEKEDDVVEEEAKEDEPETKEKLDNLTEDFITNLEEVFAIFV